MTRAHVPEQITLSSGEVLKPVVNGKLADEEFVSLAALQKYELGGRWELDVVRREAGRRKLKFRLVEIVPFNQRIQALRKDRRPRPMLVFVEVKTKTTE